MRNSRRYDRSTATAHRHNRRGLGGRHSPARSFLALAALALSLPAAPAAAQTLCTRTGTGTAVTVTCTGDQSNGIDNRDILDAPTPTTPTPAFPGTGMPPTTAPETITVNVRDLEANAMAGLVPNAGINLSFGTGGIPAPTRPAPITPPPPEATQEQRGLGVFTLDVDLGALSIGTRPMQPPPVTAIPLAVANTSAVIVNAQDQLRTSVVLRLRGDFRTTGIPSTSLINVNNQLSSTGTADTEGDVEITLREGSRVQTILDDFPDAIRALTNRGAATITLESGVSVTATRAGPPGRFAFLRGITAAAGIRAGVPGDARVLIKGAAATDGTGNRIPNVQIDSEGATGILAQATGNVGAALFERGAVAVTTAQDSYVLTTLASSPAIRAESTRKNITIEVAGAVETRGGVTTDQDFLGVVPSSNESLGILALTQGAPEVLVTVQSTGSVTTTGDEADAIRLITRGLAVVQDPDPDAAALGPSTLRAIVDGTVSTLGKNADGVVATVRRVPETREGNVDVAVSGMITTMGESARGVYGETAAGNVAAVMGIRMDNGTPQIVTKSRITTEGEGADGISLLSRGPALPPTGPPPPTPPPPPPPAHVSANIAAGTISTEGNNAVALRALVDDGDPMTAAVGDITLSVGEAGTLTTQGATAHAIEAMTEQGDVGITVDGTVTTMGTNARGVRAATNAGNVVVSVAGTVQTGVMATQRRGALGIRAQTEAGDVTAVMGIRMVDGTPQIVTTSGVTTTGDGADGISLLSRGPAPGAMSDPTRISATIAAGTISTMGNEAAGLRALVDDGDPMTTAVGNIDVASSGMITTLGENAHGILAQTEAGDVTAVMGMRRVGGMDQTVTTSSITTEGDGAHGISLLTRGPVPPSTPGMMSDPARVSATIAAGTISTEGNNAIALRAVVNDANPFTTNGRGNVDIMVASGATLETRGTNAHGLEAFTEQGDVSITVAGEVETGVPDDAMTSTRGQGALGILAETFAGNITANVTGTILTRGDTADALNADVSNGSGTAVGNIAVNVAQGAALETRGRDASGIEASTQLGNVAVTVNGTVTTTGVADALGIEAGSDAGDVTVTMGMIDSASRNVAGSRIETQGERAHGIVAFTNEGKVDVTVNGMVTTRGEDADGILLQILDSAPGAMRTTPRITAIIAAGTISTEGAESAALRARVDDGGTGTAMGNIVLDVKSEAKLETRGRDAHGLVAMTEEGEVSVTVAGEVQTGVTDDSMTPTRGQGALGIQAQTGAGDITVNVMGRIRTQGDDGVALRATVEDSDPMTPAVGDITLSVGEAGTLTTQGKTAHAIEATTEQGEVVVTANGMVTTRGTNAHGVRARTPVGDVTAVVGRTVVDGTVRTVASSRIETRGMGAHGIDAETGDGTVEIAAGGSVETRGAGGHAIRAVTGEGRVRVAAGGSIGTRGAGGDAIRAVTGDGTVAVTVQRGRVFAAAAAATTAAAVRAQAGLGPSQRLQLTVQEGGEVEGELAVAFTGGSDMAANPNRILLEAGSRLTGTLALGAGADLLENRGLLVLLGSSQFGAGVDRFLQAGRLELGRVGQVEAVSVWGLESVEFTSNSLLVIDVDGIGARTDRLEFGAETTGGAGPAVTLGGVVQVRELPGRGNFRVGDRRFEIFSAGRLVGGAGALRLISPTSSPARMFRRFYQLVGEDGATELGLVERTEGSFFDPNAPRNARAVGLKLDRVARRAELPEAIEVLLSTLGDMEKGPPYETAQNRLHAEPYDALLQGSWHAERALVDALWEGCVPGPGGHCVFGGLFGRRLDRVGEPVQADFEELAVGPRGGVSRHLGELGGRSWLLRVGAAYEALDLEWREGAGGRGDRLLGGMALHSHSAAGGSDDPWRGLDGLNAGLALAGGGAWFETERALNQLGFTRAEAEPELTFLGGHGRLLYRLGATQRDPGWYAEFGLEGSAVALWLDSFSEEEGTAGVLRLRLAETRELVTSVRPQLSLGGSWQWGELHIAPRARLGFSYAVGGADTPYQADWIAVPNCSLTTWGDRENGLIEASGGLAVTLGEEISLRLDYTGWVSPDGTTRSHEGQLRAELRF